jgi:hypothetical protein
MDRNWFKSIVGSCCFILATTEASLAQISASNITGCWDRQITRNDSNAQLLSETFCFRTDGTAYFRSIGDGSGTEELFAWSIRSQSIVIDEQTCSMIEGSNAQYLSLGRCIFGGIWQKKCSEMTSDKAGCAK